MPTRTHLPPIHHLKMAASRSSLQVPSSAAASNRPPRQSSLPRSPKSTRGRPRKVASPLGPPTVNDRIATMRKSPFFLPALVAFLAFVVLLILCVCARSREPGLTCPTRHQLRYQDRVSACRHRVYLQG